MTTTPGLSPANDSPPRVGDIVATVLLSLLAVAAGLVAAFFTAFFVMASDGCSPSAGNCRYGLLDGAYVVSWGGTALGGVVLLIGLIVAVASKRRPLFVWPLLALGIIVATFLIGAAMVEAGTGVGMF
ncbi:MAG: hypothetical protein QM728_09980 [Gordonia sp. (in: high G+C Gram-positive bacteria)]|uniref:hypothetical protein n=1 Tax=Gordonia sp. (in: high G+C Gram-positive bacteria) TaxID=84139 RepID=UPI0039E37F21